MLPIQHSTASAQDFSLTRDTQLRTILESAFDAILGHGVVNGANLQAGTGFEIIVLAEDADGNPTVFFDRGVPYVLSSDFSYSGANVASDTIYLWGRLVRTAASPASPTYPLDPDTYALAVTHNLTGVNPDTSLNWFPLGIYDTNGSGVLSATINDVPDGKFVGASPNMVNYRRVPITTNYQILIGDRYIFATTTGGVVTATLPKAKYCRHEVMMKRLTATANNAVLAAGAGDTIEGGANYPLTTQYESVEVVSDGINKWWVI